MENFVQPHRNTIAQSLDYKTAQSALSVLQAAGFPAEQFSLMPEELDPNSSINQTEAAKGAGVGAMSGSLFGSLMGGLVAYGSTVTAGAELTPTHLIGLALAGAGIGAVSVSILGALTGANVHKGQEVTAPVQQYILVAEVNQDELIKAQALLQQEGIPVTPN
jgi:hypothetical protein